MEQKKSSQDRGQFNLDFEESVLLRGALQSLKTSLDLIVKKIDTVLNSSRSTLSEVDKDMLREAKDIARKAKKK